MPIINYITQINFGPGAIKTLPQECQRLKIRRPLLVTDAGIRASGLLERVLNQLDADLPRATFDRTPSNPTEAAVNEAAELYKSHRCDGIVAVGGGSSIDLGKAVALTVTHPGDLRTFAAIEGGAARITASVAPVIAVSTTAGTGSEVGRAAVIVLADGRKLGLLSPHMVPKSAICDPELTFGLPAFLTAATGMDAIAHCIETFLSSAYNPPADAIALDGLTKGWSSIETAVAEPGNLEARTNMMCASLEGALAFQKGLGCVHSLSHSLGGIDPRLHHGTLNAVFLPAVLEFNAEAPSVIADRRMERLRAAMNLHPGASIAEAVREKNRRLGLPAQLSAMGVDRGMFPRVIMGALADHCHATNPRPAASADYEMMLLQSL